MNRGPLAAFHRANTLTYLSLFSGVAAIAAASHGNGAAAGALIALSVIADTFDGRFARLFERSDDDRRIGMQLDSLSDAIAFGAAPAASFVLLAPRGSGVIEVASWTAVGVFAACAIARLAFYNVTHEWRVHEADGFVGLPAPVAALLWSSLWLANPGPATSVAVLLAIAVGMILPVRIPRPRGAALALFALWPVSVVIVYVLL